MKQPSRRRGVFLQWNFGKGEERQGKGPLIAPLSIKGVEGPWAQGLERGQQSTPNSKIGVFIFMVLSEHIHVHSFMVEVDVCNRPYGPQSLKYLSRGPFQSQYIRFWARGRDFPSTGQGLWSWGWRRSVKGFVLYMSGFGSLSYLILLPPACPAMDHHWILIIVFVFLDLINVPHMSSTRTGTMAVRCPVRTGAFLSVSPWPFYSRPWSPWWE